MSNLTGLTPKAADVVGVFAHGAAILLMVSYMRISNERSVLPLLAFVPAFRLTGSNKGIHTCVVLTATAVELFYWYQVAHKSSQAGLFVSALLLSVFASGPI